MRLLVNEIPKYFEITRGIEVGEEMDILSKGTSVLNEHLRCYLVQGKKGTPIVLYHNEITLLREQHQEY